MPTRTLLAAVACTAVFLPGETATTALGCATVPPKTVSPTGSRLWTGVDGLGEFAAAPDYVNGDGSVWLKAPWFAAGPRGRPRRGPRGVLRISGTRMGRVDAPLRAQTRQVWVEGFGGSGVWAVVLTFPTDGCWGIVGRVNRTSHSFRLLVTKAKAP